MKRRSALGKRVLEQVAELPFENSDRFRDETIGKICRPAGYFPVTDEEQFRDLYAFCVLRLVLAAEENSGSDLDNILFDQPLVIRSSSASLTAACSVCPCLMMRNVLPVMLWYFLNVKIPQSCECKSAFLD